jgi:hypothetical protein
MFENDRVIQRAPSPAAKQGANLDATAMSALALAASRMNWRSSWLLYPSVAYSLACSHVA